MAPESLLRLPPSPDGRLELVAFDVGKPRFLHHLAELGCHLNVDAQGLLGLLGCVFAVLPHGIVVGEALVVAVDDVVEFLQLDPATRFKGPVERISARML